MAVRKRTSDPDAARAVRETSRVCSFALTFFFFHSTERRLEAGYLRFFVDCGYAVGSCGAAAPTCCDRSLERC